MICPIVLYGNPILRERAKEVAFATNITQLVSDMFETMQRANGCGLAAPQIGKSIKMFVIEVLLKEGEDPVRRVMVNPVVEVDENIEANIFEEGCLSIPEVMVPVLRKESISVKYFDENWKVRKETFKGFLARVVLHEYDHLVGILHVDYASADDEKKVKEKLESIKKGEVQASYEVVR